MDCGFNRWMQQIDEIVRTEIRTTNIRSSLNEMNVSLLMQAAAKAQVVAKKYQSARNNFGHTPHLSFSDIL